LFSPLREENRFWVVWGRLLRNIFVVQRGEATGGWWRELRNDRLHYLYSSPNIIRIIKSRSMNSSGHIARIGEVKNVYKTVAYEKSRACGKPRFR
jgi:hypothetical protein